MDLRQESYGKPGYQPTGSVDTLFPGTFYLEEVGRFLEGIARSVVRNPPPCVERMRHCPRRICGAGFANVKRV